MRKVTSPLQHNVGPHSVRKRGSRGKGDGHPETGSYRTRDFGKQTEVLTVFMGLSRA